MADGSIEQKSPYRVPTMQEVAAVPWNGLTVASTFSGCGGSCTGYRMAGYKVAWANEFVPSAQESYKANAAPGCTLDRRDIKLVQPQEVLDAIGIQRGELDLLDGSPPCFAAGTPAVTARGVIPIEQVVAGDLVLTHRNRWRRVLRTMSRKAATIVVDGRIECTADHPYFARTCENRWDNSRRNRRDMAAEEPSWIAAGEVAGHFCASPMEVEQSDMPEAPSGFSYSDEFWYAVGRWVGDGWLRLDSGEGPSGDARLPQNASPTPCAQCGKPSSPHRRIAGAYTNYCGTACRIKHKRRRRRPRAEVVICTERSDADDMLSRMSMLGAQVGVSHEATVTKLRISRKSLAQWLLRWFGRGAAAKTIPGWCLGMQLPWREKLFEGYDAADGDGNQATSVSRCLAVGIALLATGLGKTVGISGPYLNKAETIEGRKVNVRPQWQVRYKDDDGRYTRTGGGMRWRKIRRKTKPGSVESVVYDIEVDEDHSFTADVFAVHNCQAFSTAGKRHKGWGKDKTYEHGAKQKNEDLFQEYARLLKGLMPRTFVAENVSGLIKGVAKGYFIEILKALKESGYRVECRVLDAQWLGVPQCRQRTIFVGVREDLCEAHGVGPVHPKPLPYRYSVREACPWIGKAVHDTSGKMGGGVNSYSAGEVIDRPSPAIPIVIAGLNTRHFAVEDAKPILKMGAYGFFPGREVDLTSEPAPSVAATGLGSYGYDLENVNQEIIPLPPSILKAEGAFAAHNVDPNEPCPTVTCASPGNDLAVSHAAGPETDISRYAIGEEWDKLKPGEQSDRYFNLVKADPKLPCPAILAGHGSGSIASVTHPTEKRKFTIAELRRIGSFPDDYVLCGNYSDQWARIGNSVPPIMAFWVARTIRDQVLFAIDGRQPWEHDPPCLVATGG